MAMDVKHKDILITKRPALVENLNMRDGLFTQLIARKVLNQRMVRTIQHGKSPDQQAEELLNILPTRGPHSFDMFCEALAADDQEDIVKGYLKPGVNLTVASKPKTQSIPEIANDDSSDATPALFSFTGDENQGFTVKYFTKPGHEKRSQSFTNGQFQDFRDDEIRYVLKHFTSDPTASRLKRKHAFPSTSRECDVEATKLSRADSIDTMNLKPNGAIFVEHVEAKRMRFPDNINYRFNFDDEEIDLTDGLVNVKVESCSRQFYLSHYRQAYQMKKVPRGKAIIINVNKVENKSPRQGTDIDRDNLANLLRQLDLSTDIYNDDDGLTADGIKSKLQSFATLPEHEEADCSLVCLLSHGEEGFLYGTDGQKLILNNVFKMFDNKNSPNLVGKPKIFIIQACRGDAFDRGVQHQQSVDETDGFQDDTASSGQMPTMSDTVICYPTQAGYYAWRNRERGSWYIEAIVEIFMRHAHCEDICTMLNRVNQVVSRKVSRCSQIDRDQMSQMSEYKSALTKPHLYFFPGIGSG